LKGLHPFTHERQLREATGATLMKIVMIVVGGLLMLLGGVWFLQGINILPGSFMTGDRQWALNGALAFVVGLALVVYALRRRR
jgi:hypothetical protein